MSVRAAGLTLAALLLAACAPGAPDGVDKAKLDAAVAKAVGDPGTCVLISDGSKTVYRFGSNTVCGRRLPACEKDMARTADEFLQDALVDRERLNSSCPSTADGSRLVAWSAAPIEGGALVYAAVMEGDQVPPGVVIADKLQAAFKAAGL